MEEENRLPGAKQSPRIDKNNVIKWYYGDTFEIHWHLVLSQNESIISYAPEDQVIFSFYEAGTRKLVQRFVCTNIDTETNMMILQFDKVTSLKFKPGRYTFDVKYINFSIENDGNGNEYKTSDTQDITTVGAKYLVEVERCQ